MMTLDKDELDALEYDIPRAETLTYDYNARTREISAQDPQDKIWDFVALVWPIRSRVITTSSAVVRCCNFLRGPSVDFTRYISLPCIGTPHLG